MPTSHSSSHAFTSIYNTNHENIITPTTYSWDANWWRIYSSCEYVVEKLIYIHKYEKTSFHASSLGNRLNKFQIGIVQCTTT
jgi:hypothetical protein